MMQTDKSATLSTHNTQTLFVPIPIADKATRYKGGGDTRNNDGSANGLGIGEPGAPAYTLTAADRHGVAYAIDRAAFNQGQNAQYGISIQEELAQTLVAKGPGGVCHTVPTSHRSDLRPRLQGNRERICNGGQTDSGNNDGEYG